MDYKARRQKLYKLLGDEGVLFLSSGYEIHRSADEAYPFNVNRNFYYLTGINQKDSYLLVDLKTQKESLYILDNDEKLAKWIGSYLTHDEANKISNIECIYSANNKDKIFEEAFGNTLIYLDLEKTEYFGGINYGEYFSSVAKKINENIIIRDTYKEIISLRAIKDEDEINEIKNAINVTKKALEAVMKNLKKLKNEREVHALFEERIKSLAGATPSFDTIAANGKNAAVLHYHDNKCDFESNSSVLLDLGARTNFYNADISRVYPINGKFSELHKQIYNIVLSANKLVQEKAAPGVSLVELQRMTISCLTEGCLQAGLIKTADEIRNYYYHSVSHHLGLDVHDPMGRDTILEEGNVITNEPGLYFEELHIGVRIEDDLLITKDGCVNLSQDIIKEIEDIENFMK